MLNFQFIWASFSFWTRFETKGFQETQENSQYFITFQDTVTLFVRVGEIFWNFCCRFIVLIYFRTKWHEWMISWILVVRFIYIDRWEFRIRFVSFHLLHLWWFIFLNRSREPDFHPSESKTDFQTWFYFGILLIQFHFLDQ